MGREELVYKWAHLVILIFWKRCLLFSIRSSLCFTSISGRSNSLKRSNFQLKALLHLHIISSPLRQQVVFGKMVWGQVTPVKFLTFHTQWLWQMQFMDDLTCWLWYVYTAGNSMLVGWESLSALALIYFILLTTVKACSRAFSMGCPSCLRHIIQSGIILHIVISVLPLVFVLTRWKLTLSATRHCNCVAS